MINEAAEAASFFWRQSMKVRLLISRAGNGFVQSAGDEVEVSDEEAKRLMEAVPPKAVPVRETRATEKTTRKSGKKA